MLKFCVHSVGRLRSNGLSAIVKNHVHWLFMTLNSIQLKMLNDSWLYRRKILFNSGRWTTILMQSVSWVLEWQLCVTHHMSPRTSCDWLEMAFVNEEIEYNLFGFGTIRHICCIVGKRVVIVLRRFSDSSFSWFRLSKIRRYGILSLSTPVRSKLIAPGSKS